MGLVHLVRHANHAEVGRMLSGRSDIALDASGMVQAEALVSALEGMPIASIHSSPRRRALQTAAPIAHARGMEVGAVPALDEIDFGAFTGLGFEALDRRADWHAWNARRSIASCPNGETMAQAVSRAADFVCAVAQREAPAVCFSHCDIIRGIVAHLLGLPMERIFMLDCEPASVTTLSIDGGAMRVVTLNSCVRRRARA
ncbi:histidine phosphatase family protein [Novosphingobium resinovorum]|uniref:histidine phosphatase family protein n=1 Tax=Novosphingobium TaxID=165696 RepID=UPI001B3CA205|nr:MULTISPECIES: histidine phosphatase family protein [Novosphingobium]MBF7013821.1 histidine phosphatase family protein [Novosphingobium sp. HR1a]WJM25965.1 histidine phosphatase family protein [Novosphingobium resinovorum]